MFVPPCHFPISFLRDIQDLSYLYSPLGIQDNTCLFCRPRQFGTGEFLPPQHNRRTIPSGSRLQAHQIRHCGAVAFTHTITSSLHLSLLFSRARRLESFLSAISSATPPLQRSLSNAASQPVVVAAVAYSILQNSSADNSCSFTTEVIVHSIPIMSSTRSTIIGAPERTAVDTDLKDIASGETQQQEADDYSVQVEQGTKARRKRYRERQRASKKKEGSAATSITTEIEADTCALSPPSETEILATEPLPPQPELKRALPRLPAVSAVEVPVLTHYELRGFFRVNGCKEDSDQGLFATQKIEQGTRIISERPILTLTAPGDQLDGLTSAFERLSKKEQTMIWNIRPATPKASLQLQDLHFFTDRLAANLQNIMLKPRADRSKAEQAHLNTATPKLENAMTTWRLAARWHANRCSMTNLPMHDRHSLPDGTPITGLFIERARIRHSCVPNCFASYDAQRGRMNIHVVRDIQMGEELTLAAFADTNYYNNAAQRAKELAAWGLTCSCEACDEKNPQFKVHEAARERASTRAVMLSDILTRLEIRNPLEVCIPSFPTWTHPFSSLRHLVYPAKANLSQQTDLTTAQSLLLALMRDLKITGCETVESVRWRKVLADRVLPARALLLPEKQRLVLWRVVMEHARECERLGKVCFGEDRAEFRQLREAREDSEAAVKMLVDGVVEALAKADSQGKG
jgi:hypothetical protein